MDWEVRDFIPFVVAILVAIGALFMIDTNTGAMYGVGMALFAAAVIFGLWSVKRFFDRAERRRQIQ